MGRLTEQILSLFKVTHQDVVLLPAQAGDREAEKDLLRPVGARFGRCCVEKRIALIHPLYNPQWGADSTYI